MKTLLRVTVQSAIIAGLLWVVCTLFYPKLISSNYWLTMTGCFLYLLPSLIAEDRHHPNKGSIQVVNVLLGWSILGWVLSLAWSVSAIRRETHAV